MEQGQLNWIANFIWGIADDVLRDLYVRGKYRDVILPMTVLRPIPDFKNRQSSDKQELLEANVLKLWSLLWSGVCFP